MAFQRENLSQIQWCGIVENMQDMFYSLENLEDMTYDWTSDSLLSHTHICDISIYSETIAINLLNFILLLFKSNPHESFQDSLKNTYNKCSFLNYVYGNPENYLKMTPLTKQHLEKDIPHTMKELIDIMTMNVTYMYGIRNNYNISEKISNTSHTQFSDCLKKLDSCLIEIIFIMKIKDMDNTITRLEKMLNKLKM